MPHRTFGAVRSLAERDPVTFDFGVFFEQRFTVVPEPSLGDTFDLADAPEPTPTNMVESARACGKFLQRMIVPDQRAAFAEALYRIPASHAHLVVEACAYVTEQVVGRPTQPSATSSGGRRARGTTSKRTSAGRAN